MWTSRAAAVFKCLRASTHFAKKILDSSLVSAQCVAPRSPLAECGYWFIQQRLHVTYNKVTKNKLLLKKTRDASFENLMDDEKRMKIMSRIIAILQKQESGKMMYLYMIRRGKDAGLVKPQRMSDMLKKYPRIIRVYREPDDPDTWVTLANPILALMEQERRLEEERIPFSIERLRKLLMMSSTRRIRLDRINYLKQELGLPDDFRETIVESHPELFRIIEIGKEVSPLVELIDWDPRLAIPAVEEYRRKEASENRYGEKETKHRSFSFPFSLPPGFKIKKGFRIKHRKWQELPYRSPYEDTSDLSLQSPEAFKRAVAVLHEFLHLCVEKRTRVDRFAHLREDMMLPQKVGITVLQHPGIFYMSTKGAVQTIFLREAYKKGELIEKDALHVVKERFLELIKIGKRSIKKEAREEKARLAEAIGDADDEQGNVTEEQEQEQDEDEEDFPGRKAANAHVKDKHAVDDEGEQEQDEDEEDFSGRKAANAQVKDKHGVDEEGEEDVSDLESWYEDTSTDSEEHELKVEKVVGTT